MNPFEARRLLVKTLVMVAAAIAVGTVAGQWIKHIETRQEPIISSCGGGSGVSGRGGSSRGETTTTTLPEIYFDASVDIGTDLVLEITAPPSENLIFSISGVGDAITISLKTGKVTINEKLTLDEASRHFWETIFAAFPGVRNDVCRTNDPWRKRYFSKKGKIQGANMGACICTSDL
jgi:hypothetical protein